MENKQELEDVIGGEAKEMKKGKERERQRLMKGEKREKKQEIEGVKGEEEELKPRRN